MSNCAKTALETLPREVLQSIKTLTSTAKAALVGIKVQKQALATSLQIELLPLQAKRVILDGIVNNIRNGIKVVPGSVSQLCAELGQVNTMVETAMSTSIEGAANALAEIDRKLSLAAENAAEIAEIDSAVEYFDSLTSDIDDILSS